MPIEQNKSAKDNKKRTLITIVSVVCVVVGAIFIFRFIAGGNEDFWFCNNGEWQKHGKPSEEKPGYPCISKIEKYTTGNVQSTQNPGQTVQGDGMKGRASDEAKKIVIVSPRENDLLSEVASITGRAPGNWFFEGSFPVRIIDSKGKEIAEGFASSYGEWMKEGAVPFHAELEIPVSSGSGWLVLQKDNPSDLRELDEEVKIPVRFGDGKNQLIKISFANSYQDPDQKDCENVYPVPRVIGSTLETARSAVEELLGGLTDLEKEGGNVSGINPGVTLRSLEITDGVAKIDFDEKLQEKVAGSCLVARIRSQITQTLKQFPSVKEVVISINGITQDILQP